MAKSEAAAELSRARWDKTTKADRKKVGAALAKSRKKLSAKLRSDIARAAAKARWAKRAG